MMKSIRIHLVRTLSYTITGGVFLILLAIDIAVDRWIDNQFNESLIAKCEMLAMIIDNVRTQPMPHTSGEFLSVFDGKAEPEYFQVWSGDRVVERSGTLMLFFVSDLPFVQLAKGEHKVIEASLPDGRSGRIAYITFAPGSADRDTIKDDMGDAQPPMTLAYASSAEGINFILAFIDVLFVITSVCVIVFIRSFVRTSVEKGLSPLNKLNEQIKRLSLTKGNALIHLAEPIEELLPIKESLNRFIDENRKLYLREKRLASDISHELKTPVAELISLTEVMLKFPKDNELEKTFAPEVLRISKRLNDIVLNILLLYRHQHAKLEMNDVFDINQVIETLLVPLENARIVFTAESHLPSVISNLFAVETILSNLISNAVIHSLPSSSIKISTALDNGGGVKVRVSNVPAATLTDEDIAQFFDPLWQKDSSRTSGENFGLGLSIAAAFAKAICARLDASIEGQIIIFSLEIKVVSQFEPVADAGMFV